jgi:cell wall-associated NlpC family hydrolase
MRYTIRLGDTLGAIANRFDTSVRRLARINDIKNPNVIQAGDRLRVPGQRDDFVPGPSRGPRADRPNRPQGGRDVQGSRVNAGGQRAVREARQYMGVRYNYSHDRSNRGFSRNGTLDCSQLVSKVYPRLPPDVVTQSRMGKSVGSVRNARAGDLVFFDENGSGRATHVGIATGRGTVVHASSFTGRVCETPIRYIPSRRTWVQRP